MMTVQMEHKLGFRSDELSVASKAVLMAGLMVVLMAVQMVHHSALHWVQMLAGLMGSRYALKGPTRVEKRVD